MLIELLISFFIGGGVITLISFFVENLPRRYAGLLLASPTTTVLGLFFLGMTVGAEAVSEVIPKILLPLGCGLFFSTIYFFSSVYFSQFHFSKLIEVSLSYMVSILLWFCMIFPVVVIRPDNIVWNLIGCLSLISAAHFLCSFYPGSVSEKKSLLYSPLQKIVRSIIIGFVISLIVYLGKTVGAFWGGIFSVFPAAFTATLPILHWYYTPQSLFSIIKKIPTGGISVVIYVLSSAYTFSFFGYIWGTLISYGISVTYILLVSKWVNRV